MKDSVLKRALIYNPMRYYGLDKPGIHVSVVSLGGLGHIAVMFLKALGIKVIVISSSPRKKEEAISKFGADLFLVSRDQAEMELKALLKAMQALAPVEEQENGVSGSTSSYRKSCGSGGLGEKKKLLPRGPQPVMSAYQPAVRMPCRPPQQKWMTDLLCDSLNFRVLVGQMIAKVSSSAATLLQSVGCENYNVSASNERQIRGFSQADVMFVACSLEFRLICGRTFWTVQKGVLGPEQERLLLLASLSWIRSFNTTRSMDTLCVYGGSPIQRQMSTIDRGVDVIVGTPGHVIDLLKIGALNLSEVKFAILDEADEMLNVGFAKDVETILEYFPKEHQTMMFSATMPSWIVKLTHKYLKTPLTIDLVNAIYVKFCDPTIYSTTNNNVVVNVRNNLDQDLHLNS
ncbi:helicase Cas3, CRISPR-associated, core [Artemisia annua]|uniref:Helicase Cas3, CRISPR-associated, core n=1 Tax=Artemisia annua TaxID=35608 RepID=A0A2U1N8E0_ARTAN|nr:helicase Cas3, CRISPR-associated, core [Artemisia annua]